MKKEFRESIIRWEQTPWFHRTPLMARNVCAHATGVIGTAWLQRWMDLILFHSVYAADEAWLEATEQSRTCLADAVKKQMRRNKAAWVNSGLPFATTQSLFTFDMLNWLQACEGISIGYAGQGSDGKPLSSLLALSLPPAEKYLTETGLEGNALLTALGIPPKGRLSFLLQQAGRISCDAWTRDYLFSSLKVFSNVWSREAGHSLSHNRLSYSKPVVLSEMVKDFDHEALMKSPVPKPLDLSDTQRDETCRVIRMSLVLLQRETDPATWMDLNSLRVYRLERGIEIAFYGMYAGRQLPFESYIGYTLFRNGWPVAYGGAWIFGHKALFGINIFPSYRGGESGYILCQLLRTYAGVFDVRSFEVEPYQYGKGNPDGIKSGAFWYYYRYGFRPADASLRKLADAEHKKIVATKGYRTGPEVLRRFTKSNLVLQADDTTWPVVPELTSAITDMIAARFGGDRSKCERAIAISFGQQFSPAERRRLAKGPGFLEAAMLYETTEPPKRVVKYLTSMAEFKDRDPYAYQRWLTKFLEWWRKDRAR